ncbi:MAG: tRNA-specific adenosine deaminase [Bacteroidetes bacterium]|nr:MAG: tRNA-specific adenosine deaminase [Bacteroidota bacterium]
MAQELETNTTQQISEDERFMRIALQEAQEAGSLDEVPVGAIIVSRGAVIARGHNLCERLKDFTAHAEMQAFTSASEFLGGKFLDECTLYVTMEPCPMCAGAGFWTRIGRIVYGAKDLKRGYGRWMVSPDKEGYGGQVGDNGLLHPKTEVTYGILEQECSKLVKDFFISKRLKNAK